MIAWPPDPIANAELEELGERMLCDFTSERRREFIDRWDSCDVQAAPGSGKTTLVVAKLFHLSRRWPFDRQGVCVLSHTNVAREEIEEKLASIPEAARLLAYPSFIGTLTSFFHTFLALPLLRGLGWPMSRVDDELFEARCCARFNTKPTLRRTPKANRRRVTGWAKKLTLAPDFELSLGAPTPPVKVCEQQGLFRRSTTTRRELEELKAEICAAGIYRYDDMIVLATRALELAPHLVTRLAARFPFVLLDEAQDTAPRHLELVERIFGDGRSCLQRIGDCNQAILGVGDEGEGWSPAEGYLDLGESLRFGPEIATFASALTCAREQEIRGEGGQDCQTHVMLIGDGGESHVGSRFAELVASELTDAEDPNVWAVGFTHSLSDSVRALRVGTYFESYLPPQRSPDGEPTLLGALQKELAKGGSGDGRELGPIVDVYARQIRLLLATFHPQEDLVSIRRVWRWLDEARQGSAQEVRAVLRRIVHSQGAVSATEWGSLTQELRAALAPRLPADFVSAPLSSMLAHTEVAADEEVASKARGWADYQVGAGSVRVNIGTVASVKGRTHDATLIVQTTDGSVRDVKSALQVVLGNRERLDKPKVRRAVMNVFVASTRPRRLLCLALQADKAVLKLRPKLEEIGLTVIEVP